MYSQVLQTHHFFLELLQQLGPMMRPVCHRAMSMLRPGFVVGLVTAGVSWVLFTGEVWGATPFEPLLSTSVLDYCCFSEFFFSALTVSLP